MKERDGLKLIAIFVLSLLILLFLIRNFSEIHLDDVSPQIYCEPKLLEKADFYYVIPLRDNLSIADNKEWCENIIQSNKKVGIHGVSHTYLEFKDDIDDAYLNRGITEFEKCFGEKPEHFRPPQLKISESNKKLVESRMKFQGQLSYIFHKVYHCDESVEYNRKKNRLMDWF